MAVRGSEETQLVKVLLIMAGGSAGALLRYGLSGWAQRLSGSSEFPWGTLVVNMTGCLAIGLLGGMFSGAFLVREEVRVGLLIGLLGAFTTFSTFGWESFMLLNEGRWILAAMNILTSNVLGLGAVFIGYRVSERIWGV